MTLLQVAVTAPSHSDTELHDTVVELRDRAIKAMQQLADIDPNTVVYLGTDDTGTLWLTHEYAISLWQCDLIAARFSARGELLTEATSVAHRDTETGYSYTVSVVQPINLS